MKDETTEAEDRLISGPTLGQTYAPGDRQGVWLLRKVLGELVEGD